jgi:hypothetical protein
MWFSSPNGRLPIRSIRPAGVLLAQRAIERRDIKRSIAAALAAEIEAQFDLVKKLRMVERGEELLAALQRGENRSPKGFVFAATDSLEAYPIFRLLVGQIGALGLD